MDFAWIWSAVCADVRRHFGVASTFCGETEIWVYQAVAWHIAVEDSIAGPRLAVTLIFENDRLCDESLGHVASRINRAEVGVHIEVREGGFIVARHGSMLSAYDGDSLLPIIRMLGDAFVLLERAGREPMSQGGAFPELPAPSSEVELYLAREAEEFGGTFEHHRDALLLWDAGRDLVPHPRAVPDFSSVTTECPVVETMPTTGTGAGIDASGGGLSR